MRERHILILFEPSVAAKERHDLTRVYLSDLRRIDYVFSQVRLDFSGFHCPVLALSFGLHLVECNLRQGILARGRPVSLG